MSIKNTMPAPDSRPIVAVHLDFKGVQFRPEYFPQLFRDLAGLHINAVLVEYEDIFPFKDIEIAFDKSTAWSQETLANFLGEAQRNNIEVIPLQQTLGHLEYVFRWNRYRKFALDPAYPSTLHLNQPEAKALIFEMLNQVIAVHSDSRFIHLGMDEAHSLIHYAEKEKCEVLNLFLDHLDQLCSLCEAHGKTPIIWSDMFEDHLTPSTLPRLKQFASRVVLCPWDYGSTGERIAVGRIAGFRASRYWQDHPFDANAPALSPEISWIEDLPNVIHELVAPYIQDRHFLPMFQADLWSGLGFRVLGASGACVSADGAILPYYHLRLENIRAWSRACRRTGVLGQVATAWARGTTFTAPNFPFDLAWPQFEELAKTMGAEPTPFFDGIAPETIERIILRIGRCRVDWQIEEELLREMEEVRLQLKTHHYEWQSLMLMLRVWERLRHAKFVCDEVDYFRAGWRLIDDEWQRRLNDQTRIIEELNGLRDAVRAHFEKRYYGEAFEEWLRHIFDLPLARLEEYHQTSLAQAPSAQALYD